MGLGGALLGGLFAFMALDLSCRALRRAGCPERGARGLALLLLGAALAGGGLLLASFLGEALTSAPEIADAAVPRLLELFRELGLPAPFDGAPEAREAALRALRENLGSVTEATGAFAASALRVLLAAAAAAFFFMTPPRPPRGRSVYARLLAELRTRVRRFMDGFEKVLGAQLVISLINTALTACYLLWAGIPHFGFLVPATFLLGIVPIVGNVMSNVLIVGAALTLSPKAALLSLGFLVFIHTLEHFLNSRVVGGRIEAPMWLTLLAIMGGELALGVPGIVLAPALLHYVREELRAIPA